MKTILIVDDNKCIRDLLSFTLTAFFKDCIILTAENGAKAVQLLNSLPVSVIMTDLSMPVMDGYQLMEHVRGRSFWIPIIAMTGQPGADVDERLKSFGVEQCFEKPFDFQEVMQKIALVLGLTANVGTLTPLHAAGRQNGLQPEARQYEIVH